MPDRIDELIAEGQTLSRQCTSGAYDLHTRNMTERLKQIQYEIRRELIEGQAHGTIFNQSAFDAETSR